MEPLVQNLVDAIQRHVGKNRADDAALRRALVRFVPSALLHEPRFQELPEHLHGVVEGLCAKWTSHMPPVPGMEAVVEEIKAAGRGLYLLSNFNKRLRNELHLAPSLLLFDGLVISGEIGLVKPNADIYEYLLATYKLNPAECIFVDDRQDNLDAGEQAGIKGYLFDGDAEKLRTYLKKEGII